MLPILLSYLAGALTIVSPCILPVLPFVFSRAQAPFLRGALPLLLGMALTFAAVASLATVGGGWVVAAHQQGRWLALALLGLFGLALLSPRLAERLARPMVALGGRLAASAARHGEPRPLASALLGVATGLLWAPCAGPILGLILTGAALQGASLSTGLLLLAYALGAATSMALALLVGGRVLSLMQHSIGAGERLRRGLGAAMLAGVVAVALGWDARALAALPGAATAGLEQALLDGLGGGTAAAPGPAGSAQDLRDEGPAPALDGATTWLNGPPLSGAALQGKVVLVDFWTYACINCLHTLPHVKAWAQRYGSQGLVVVGVHTPEFAFERDLANVRQAVRDLGVSHPVAVDNDYRLWRAFGNQFWPAHYLIDARGRIRYHQFGEGGEAQTERALQRLLAEAARGE